MPRCGDVREMQHESTASQIELNRRCFVKIVETLLFLARQGLALRGDNSDNDSKFIQTLKLHYEPRYSKQIDSNYGESNYS